ncbi:hypothetical protein K493DRAFT_310393 [Basidiobolus meristosporus CBS 931.73]|uniref:Uncharacterized protein n=1 Tax=Basidiobolus meristosporus CBS 931.73 TaxID=1314790 RepID=A0A1Y1ZA55_9FUNG|nr:hypothetical protein K493DRAFT_310393 [Basidiobolus meristosporus CBS 931.73]|eukprot:ORY06994.1 hypothetical protein K493DRAFT_310393 [Basidiobolus meristosporus CBS 931.73]
MTVACLLLVLSFIKQFPGRCELKISLRWMRRGLSGLEPELKDINDQGPVADSQPARVEEAHGSRDQTQQVSSYTSAIANPLVYPKHVYQPASRASELNPSLNPSSMAPQAHGYNGPVAGEESTSNRVSRYPGPYPPNFVDRNLSINASPWNTIHPSQYPYTSPNRWMYNPSIRTYAPMNGSPYYLPTQFKSPTQLQPQPQLHLPPSNAGGSRNVASEEDARASES